MDINEPDARLTGGYPLPQNREAEASVLGAAMLSNKILPDVFAMLEPEDFYFSANRVIASAMRDMYQRDIAVDPTTLKDYLERAGKVQLIGGNEYLLDLINDSYAMVNWQEHAKIVKRNSTLRRIIAASTSITALAFDAPPEDIQSIVDKAEGMLLGVTNREVQSASKPLSEFITQAYDEIEAVANNKGHVAGVSTGFALLDKVLLGLRAGTMTIVGARPGVGKTSFALSLARNAAKAGVPVVFFSLEMSGSEIAARMMCAEAGISNEAIRSGNITPDMWTPLVKASEDLSKLDFTIDDTAGTNVVEIRTKARRILQDKPTGLIIVDYLQLITPANPRQTDRNVQVGEMSRALKVLAKELQVPVITLSQLNRDVERRPDKRPMLADLRDSGSIEQDADVVLFIDRSLSEEEVKSSSEKNDRPPLGEARIIVAKNRAGRSGVDIPLAFLAERTLFRDLSRREG